MSGLLTLQTRGQARALTTPQLRQRLKRQLARAMSAAGEIPGEVCLSLTDDEEVHALNQSFAGEDHATDVLSFSQQEGLPMPGPGQAVLGDVVISVETAERQAQVAGHDLLHELLHLSVHGLVHLLGYDHATPDEERRMFGYEALLREQARKTGKVVAVPRP